LKSYVAFERATFFGLKSNPATERFHGIDRLVFCPANSLTQYGFNRTAL
jgi:hypothetical protein